MLGNELHLDLSGQELTQQGVDTLAIVIKEGSFTKLSLRGARLPDITNASIAFGCSRIPHPSVTCLN